MAEGIVIRFGEVTGVDDAHDGGRIQARTVYDNKTENDGDLQYYIPFMPRFFYVKPKVGELVLLISMAVGQFDNFNYYIGPIISQENKLFFEDRDKALAVTETAYDGWGPNPRLKEGVLPTLYPGNEDVAIEGRKDTGIQLKDEEVRIKAGVKLLENGEAKNNIENPAFISLKYYPDNEEEKDGYKSTATIVADKINLISPQKNDSATSDIPVTCVEDGSEGDRDNLISDSAMRELLNKAHQLPYGDQLVEFLDLLRTAFAKHVHPFPTMAPCNDENMKKVATYDLEGMLSDNVRIN